MSQGRDWIQQKVYFRPEVHIDVPGDVYRQLGRRAKRLLRYMSQVNDNGAVQSGESYSQIRLLSSSTPLSQVSADDRLSAAKDTGATGLKGNFARRTGFLAEFVAQVWQARMSHATVAYFVERHSANNRGLVKQ